MSKKAKGCWWMCRHLRLGCMGLAEATMKKLISLALLLALIWGGGVEGQQASIVPGYATEAPLPGSEQHRKKENFCRIFWNLGPNVYKLCLERLAQLNLDTHPSYNGSFDDNTLQCSRDAKCTVQFGACDPTTCTRPFFTGLCYSSQVKVDGKIKRKSTSACWHYEVPCFDSKSECGRNDSCGAKSAVYPQLVRGESLLDDVAARGDEACASSDYYKWYPNCPSGCSISERISFFSTGADVENGYHRGTCTFITYCSRDTSLSLPTIAGVESSTR
jgi:hypothetical protein